MNSLSPIDVYRAGRVMARQLLATEPYVALAGARRTEYHGGAAGGWGIPRDCLSADSIVVDVGLGEDLDFAKQLHEKYGCAVHGFRPALRSSFSPPTRVMSVAPLSRPAIPRVPCSKWT